MGRGELGCGGGSIETKSELVFVSPGQLRSTKNNYGLRQMKPLKFGTKLPSVTFTKRDIGRESTHARTLACSFESSATGEVKPHNK